ncbi:MAG: hypothetical protein HXX15_18695 [Rhodopseudomonas sp.]|uniref:hypothetical protein n=1 Tax=Rhodopseudomonas sp. TaxID=1078 RepID=UPI0017CE2133|nr:hypothetical protein [Rhodopseudomonas sp.]NVN88113.1 hypothetical protein [Rhodopseudomonas sp.]
MDTYNDLLEIVPSDPAKAQNYTALLALWKEQKTLIDVEELESSDDFSVWEEDVSALLDDNERAYFRDEQNVLVYDVRALRIARINLLTKILIHRHGINLPGGFQG